ncbi:hypothetical protein [Compostibacter hankyongensis]|uniref:BZIP transcription factor n=1 Tax=Compostibacter hankyongensis TaxID=1007089 RepID=A0ABP8G011_9BACT
MLFALVLGTSVASGQTTNTFPATGNAGIGTLTPSQPLEIRKDMDSSIVPTLLLHNNQYNYSQGAGSAIWFQGALADRYISMESMMRGDAMPDRLIFKFNNDGTIISPFTIRYNGNVGIGTTVPNAKLEVEGGSIRLTNPGSYPYGYNLDVDYPGSWKREYSFSYNHTGKLFVFGVYGTAGTLNYGYIGGNTTATTASPWMAFLPSGNVLIGKTYQTNTSYKLDVNGNVRANKVVVNTTGADFVFDPAYRLPTLDSLNGYIATHRHLPDVPSAETMQREGLDVGDNQVTLLQKIEELTLYLIDQQKEIMALKKEIAALKKKQ